jgi:hypothetical protein
VFVKATSHRVNSIISVPTAPPDKIINEIICKKSAESLQIMISVCWFDKNIKILFLINIVRGVIRKK